MLKKIVFLFLLTQFSFGQSQESRVKDFDLIHTELHLKPIWQNENLEGTAILTLKPYFYPQNKLTLNARGFIINSIEQKDKKLDYVYNNEILNINLTKNYTLDDTLKIRIKYIAQPNLLTSGGSEAITSDKGLYFINAKKSIANLPQQLWTQGETQSNSAWFPTIDSPNQNHKQDIYITVDKYFTTLSNGILVDTKFVAGNLKTDHWKQDKPHAVYLTMMAVGDWKKVVDDTFKRFEVSYYLEPAYEKYAKGIFGRTPEMINYFEKILGVPFQWQKYAQIPVRKYVSGAMENTTATVHSKTLLKTGRQLLDGNDDGVIAHELFHHWFGNYVTCESWGQLPLNESFANYSEFLWASYKYGKSEGDYVNRMALNEYLAESSQKQVPMIRYNFVDREDMFDAHSYQKGGRILNLLRLEVGDKAFFQSLNFYLKSHALETVEIHDLRLVFEKVTGRDLKWFFDQWFFKSGHPRINITKTIEGTNLKINVSQKIDSINNTIYRIPLNLAVLSGDSMIYCQMKLDAENNEAVFDNLSNIKTVVFDPDGYFLGEQNYKNSEDELIFQFKKSKDINARMDALELLTTSEDSMSAPLQNKKIRDVLLLALKDDFWRIREMAVLKFNNYDGDDFLTVEKSLQSTIRNDPKSNVRAAAIIAVKNFLNPQNDILFRSALNDSSYLVNAAALEALQANKVADIDSLANKFKDINDMNIFAAVGNIYANNPKPEFVNWFLNRYQTLEGTEVYQNLGIFGSYLLVSNPESSQKALPLLKSLAIDSGEWYVRAGAVQVLFLLKDNLSDAKEIVKEAIKKETDKRLIKFYEQLDVTR